MPIPTRKFSSIVLLACLSLSACNNKKESENPAKTDTLRNKPDTINLMPVPADNTGAPVDTVTNKPAPNPN